jgi:hypothetical protein
MRFAARHELKLLHFGTRALGALVRLGLVRALSDHAEALLRFAALFNRFGTGSSGFHMIMSGAGHDGQPTRRRFMLVARDGHGPYIPCAPAILLTRRLAKGEIRQRGASPCLDLIDLDDYLAALSELDVTVLRDTIPS